MTWPAKNDFFNSERGKKHTEMPTILKGVFFSASTRHKAICVNVNSDSFLVEKEIKKKPKRKILPSKNFCEMDFVSTAFEQQKHETLVNNVSKNWWSYQFSEKYSFDTYMRDCDSVGMLKNSNFKITSEKRNSKENNEEKRALGFVRISIWPITRRRWKTKSMKWIHWFVFGAFAVCLWHFSHGFCLT